MAGEDRGTVSNFALVTFEPPIVIYTYVHSMNMVVNCSLTGKQSVRMTVLRMTQEEGRQQAAVQVALRDLATLPHKTVGEIPWDSSVEG